MPDATTEQGPSQAAEDTENHETPVQRGLRRRVVAQTKRKFEFVRDILLNLDMLIYAQLCVLYYMDCSFFRFIIRSIAQLTFLTPNPEAAIHVAKPRPYLPVILGANALCFFLHIFADRPSAGEVARGYLHGGIIIDFIGQKAPSSKVQLLVLDVLVLTLQCAMLAIHVEGERLKAALASKDLMKELLRTITAQDHDAEERGVMRNTGAAPDVISDDIEMQEVEPVNVPRGDVPNLVEQEQLSATRTRRTEEEVHEGRLDVFYSGNFVVGDFHVLQTLRSLWDDRESATASALQNVSYTASFEWHRARQRMLSRVNNVR